MTLEEATKLVNTLPFPVSTIGDTVKFEDYWFELSEAGWIPLDKDVV